MVGAARLRAAVSSVSRWSSSVPMARPVFYTLPDFVARRFSGIAR